MIGGPTLDLAPEPRLELRTPNEENAFTADFLNAFDDLDEPASSRESEIPGPWKIVQDGCTHSVFSQRTDATKDEALGSFLDRSLGLRSWAALATHGQPRTFACREEKGKPGLEVLGLHEKGFELLGTIDVPGSARLVTIFEVIEALARNPFALALVLESAGCRAIGHIGEMRAAARDLHYLEGFFTQVGQSAKASDLNREDRQLAAAARQFAQQVARISARIEKRIGPEPTSE